MNSVDRIAGLISERFLNKPLDCLPDHVPPFSGEWTKRQVMDTAKEIAAIVSYNPGLDEALNSGDGTYRP